jgi:hypothetical protein
MILTEETPNYLYKRGITEHIFPKDDHDQYKNYEANVIFNENFKMLKSGVLEDKWDSTLCYLARYYEYDCVVLTRIFGDRTIKTEIMDIRDTDSFKFLRKEEQI